MPATYPSSVRTWTPKQDRTDIVLADHVMLLQEEMYATQNVLGVNPHISAVFNQTYASAASRMAAADALLNTIANYFMAGGVIGQDQVDGLGDILEELTDGVNGAATVMALNSAIATVNASLATEVTNRTNAVSAEATARANADSTLQTNINSEATARGNADTALSALISALTTTETGHYNALNGRVTSLENKFKQLESQLQNNGSRNYATSASYQGVHLPNSSYITSDYGSTINGHNVVEINGTGSAVQSRFYSDFNGPNNDIYAMTCSVTWQGTGGSSNAGVRGLRIRTAGGSTLTEFIKNANQDPDDEVMSVAFIGRISGGSNYFVFPQVLQNSGGTLTLKAHAPTTPHFMTFSRIPG